MVLPNFLEVHFSLSRNNKECITRIGTTVNGVTEVQIPNELLNTENKTHDYFIYAFIYVSTEKYGNTKCEIIIPVKSRIKPENPSEEPLPEPNIFHETVEAVNAAAERAKMAEQNAKASATEAGKYAVSASESAVAAEKTKEDALRKVGEKKQEAIEAIQNQEETSVGKITTHTDGEIQRIQNQTTDSKAGLEQTITNADASKKELEHSIETAGTSKTALDKSVELAGTAKTELDTSIREAGTAKVGLDESTETAGTVQETLSATVKQAGALDTSLGEEIETGTQLKTDLIASGEKAVQDIQTAGSEQLGKMQAVAEEFTADREQITTNKEDIGSLKEDLSNKITKFYASNQGETHITDSDNGKIQDMIIYGRSSQFTTTGKNLLKYPYVEANKTTFGVTFMDNKDGSINISGTSTGIAYYNLYSNRDGKRLTLASGTYKLVVKGRSKCGVYVSNGVDSAMNEGTFTITDGHNDVWCYIEVPKGLALDETIYPMFQLASITDESYEPYTGGKPSPSPDYTQEIKSVVNPTIKVTNEDGLKVQSVTLNNITLNAIPVASGGNVTIDGQQYIADYVDVERGKVIRKVDKLVLTGEEKWKLCFENWLTYPHAFINDRRENVLTGNVVNAKYEWYLKRANMHINSLNAPYNRCIAVSDSRFSTAEEFTNELKKQNSNGTPLIVYYMTGTPQEENLSLEEIELLKSLSTYYPVTNISVTSDQLDGYTVFNYPISMANGWNYVKQQLGDTRDYIYDMDAKAQDIDIQSAEAYVNSEYAVALTELEV